MKKLSNKKSKKKDTYVLSIRATQEIENVLDIEAHSEEEAKKIAIELCQNAKLRGYLSDDGDVSDYWRPEGNINILSVELEDIC